jgi:hypothetical protein
MTCRPPCTPTGLQRCKPAFPLCWTSPIRGEMMFCSFLLCPYQFRPFSQGHADWASLIPVDHLSTGLQWPGTCSPRNSVKAQSSEERLRSVHSMKQARHGVAVRAATSWWQVRTGTQRSRRQGRELH